MAGWARIKAERHALERRVRNEERRRWEESDREDAGDRGFGLGGADDAHGMEMRDEDTYHAAPAIATNRPSSSNDSTTQSTQHAAKKSLGLEGLSLDSIPNLTASKDLMEIAKGLHVQPLDEADFYTVQVHFNRGWKLLLLGLGQQESFARYMAMVALKRAVPMINDTLLDSTTREVCLTMALARFTRFNILLRT